MTHWLFNCRRAVVGGSLRIHAGEERFSAPKRPRSHLSGFSRGWALS